MNVGRLSSRWPKRREKKREKLTNIGVEFESYNPQDTLLYTHTPRAFLIRSIYISCVCLVLSFLVLFRMGPQSKMQIPLARDSYGHQSRSSTYYQLTHKAQIYFFLLSKLLDDSPGRQFIILYRPYCERALKLHVIRSPDKYLAPIYGYANHTGSSKFGQNGI